ETPWGGWTVFQRRQDGSVDFYRNWSEYKNGFGDLQGEFWLGLDRIHRLTNAVAMELRVDLEADAGETAHAQYGHFSVSAESDKYRLSVGGYYGTAGDSPTFHNNYMFTTKYIDNDEREREFIKSCAVQYKGAWWYKNCHRANLNGFYHKKRRIFEADGVSWTTWKGLYYSLSCTAMKLRPQGLAP
ncbi:predicted protein, partial [Nematostella vectensis]